MAVSAQEAVKFDPLTFLPSFVCAPEFYFSEYSSFSMNCLNNTSLDGWCLVKSTVIEWLILCRQSFQNIGYAEIKISIILVNLQINLKIFLLLNKKYIRSTVLFFFLETPFLLKARINLSFSSSFSRFVFSFHSFFFFGWLKNKAILYPLYVDVTQLVGCCNWLQILHFTAFV